MAPHDDRTAWLVKAGKRAKHARDFVTKDMVSIGTEWPGVGDLSTASDAEVFLAIEAAGRSSRARFGTCSNPSIRWVRWPSFPAFPSVGAWPSTRLVRSRGIR